MSYLFLSKENDKEQYTLYIDSSKLNKEIKEKLEQEKIMVKPYNKIYKDVEKFDGIIYCDYSKTNYALYDLMKKPRNRVLWILIIRWKK